MRHAEIRLDHRGIAPDLVRCSIGDLAAVVEHHDPVRYVHHHAHVVLDQRDRGAELVVHVKDETAHVLLLFDVHARHRLIEQQQFRFSRQRTREFDPLLQAVGELAHRHLADRLDLQEVDDLLHDTAMRDLLGQLGPPIERLRQKAGTHLDIAARS